MQSAALQELGLAGEWSYEAIDLAPEEFAERVRALPGDEFVGANVTIPHKEAALALADEASGAAREIGAANTLSFGEEGISADNTDAPGLLAALPEPVAGRRALVLGAGGSGRAVVGAVAGEGARVEVWNRTAERADALAEELSEAGEDPPEAVWADEARETAYELIVNCTAVGMKPDDELEHVPVDPERLGDDVVVVDLVYAGGETPLIAEARKRGAVAVDGLEELVRQGAESLRLWKGRAQALGARR